MKIKTAFVSLSLFYLAYSCGTVKSYEKSYVNDVDMELKGHYCERFETSFQIYREAASGANGGKSGGGCGCN